MRIDDTRKLCTDIRAIDTLSDLGVRALLHLDHLVIRNDGMIRGEACMLRALVLFEEAIID